MPSLPIAPPIMPPIIPPISSFVNPLGISNSCGSCLPILRFLSSVAMRCFSLPSLYRRSVLMEIPSFVRQEKPPYFFPSVLVAMVLYLVTFTPLRTTMVRGPSRVISIVFHSGPGLPGRARGFVSEYSVPVTWYSSSLDFSGSLSICTLTLRKNNSGACVPTRIVRGRSCAASSACAA